MARRTSPPRPEPELALTVSRSEAQERISQQIEKGQALVEMAIRSESDLEQARAADSKWNKFTEELLKRLFTNKSLADEFIWFGGMVLDADEPFDYSIQRFRDDVRDHLHRLESIIERLELLPEPAGTARPMPGSEVRFGKSRKIFVVHGHNEGVRESICRFLEKLKLQPIVLHEQANRGKTIIEKFEANADVEFAVVLLTADDVGAKLSERDKLQPRARQNVILELGYFTGKIGRDRVCALYENGVEVPSDYDGVIYVPLTGGWHFLLAKEIKAAGIDIDLNLAV